MSANKNPTIQAARKAADVAEIVAGRRRGELLAVVGIYRRQLPPQVGVALEAFETAEDAARFAREQIREVRDGVLTPEEARERHQLARVSALIASRVLGLNLIPSGSRVYSWKVIDGSGKTREVPNFGTDMCAMAGAEQTLEDPTARRLYGTFLERAVGSDPYALAVASPAIRALALLHAVNVSPDSDPPTVDV